MTTSCPTQSRNASATASPPAGHDEHNANNSAPSSAFDDSQDYERGKCSSCGLWITPGEIVARIETDNPWVHRDVNT